MNQISVHSAPLRIAAIAVAGLLIAGCLSLDPFLFSGEKLTAYSFDDYTGERECSDALDTVKAMEAAGQAPVVTDACIRQYRLASGDGAIAVALLACTSPPFDVDDTIIVYFRGKGPHTDFYWPRTRMLHAAGYPVLTLDYRGFGMSSGTATEASISEDGHALMRFVADSLGNPRVIVYAYSLGSLVGCDVLASGRYPLVIGLVLEAPIGSIQTLAENSCFLDIPGSYVTTYTGDNVKRIRAIHAPLLWIHGDRDETNDRETNGLPIWNNHPGDGVFLKAIGAGHTANPSVIGYRRYILAIRAFCSGAVATTYPSLFDHHAHVAWGTK
jgi:pimeloyl-ACP methyl ester carboxylesterase